MLPLDIVDDASTLIDEDTHEFVVVEHHMVPMRDGVRLATDVYRPSHTHGIINDESDSRPVVLHRTPYNKEKSPRTECCLLPDGTLSQPIDNPQTAERFARRGYVVVMQDCRGRYKSEGRFTKYVNEGDDGVDTLQWICAQPWCNGKIGCYGLSYCAHVQVSLACKAPAGLSCLFLESGGFWDAFADGVRQHGAFTMKQVTWAFKNAKVSPEVMADPEIKSKMEAIDLKDWFTRMPWKEGQSPLSLAPDYERYIFDDWQSDTFTEKWKKCGLYAKGYLEQFADVPVMIICSWYDPYIGSMTDMYRALSCAKAGPIKMVLGPWTHGDHGLTYSGDVDFGPQSTFDRNVAPTFHAARLQWFEEHLQGKLGGMSPRPGASPVPGSSPARSPPETPFLRAPDDSLTAKLRPDTSAVVPPPTPAASCFAPTPAGMASGSGRSSAGGASGGLGTSPEQHGSEDTFVRSTSQLSLALAALRLAEENGNGHGASEQLPRCEAGAEAGAGSDAAVEEERIGPLPARSGTSPVGSYASGLSYESVSHLEHLEPVVEEGTEDEGEGPASSAPAPAGMDVPAANGKPKFIWPLSALSSLLSRSGNGRERAAPEAHPLAGLNGDASCSSSGSALHTLDASAAAALPTDLVADLKVGVTSPHPAVDAALMEVAVLPESSPTISDAEPSSLAMEVALADIALGLGTPSTLLVGAQPGSAPSPASSITATSAFYIAAAAPAAAGRSVGSDGLLAAAATGKKLPPRAPSALQAHANSPRILGAEHMSAGSIRAPFSDSLLRAPSDGFRRTSLDHLPGGSVRGHSAEFLPRLPSDSLSRAPSESLARPLASAGKRNSLTGNSGKGVAIPAANGFFAASGPWPSMNRESLRESIAGSSIGGISFESYANLPYVFPAPSYPYNIPRVLYFRMGGGTGTRNSAGRLDHGGQWVDAPAWPLPFQFKPKQFYLGPGKLLVQKAPDEEGAKFSYVHDPRDPVPTIGGNVTSGEPLMVGGAYDQVERPDFFGCHDAGRPLCERPDVLSFSTPPLGADVEVTGNCRLVLFFSSDVPDTDFCATLVDVYPSSEDYPNGFAMNLANGIRRARFRDSDQEPSYLVGGEVYRVAVDLNVTSNLFKKGHSIRIDISSSCFPRYDINYGLTNEESKQPLEPGQAARLRVATNTLHATAANPSHVLLPIRKLPEDAVESAACATEPLIPFSSKWLQRRPTWSR